MTNREAKEPALVSFEPSYQNSLEQYLSFLTVDNRQETVVGNDRTLQIEVRPDGRTSSLWVRPDAGPDRTGSSGRTYRRTVTGPITEPRPDPETGPTSDDVL